MSTRLRRLYGDALLTIDALRASAARWRKKAIERRQQVIDRDETYDRVITDAVRQGNELRDTQKQLAAREKDLKDAQTQIVKLQAAEMSTRAALSKNTFEALVIEAERLGIKDIAGAFSKPSGEALKARAALLVLGRRLGIEESNFEHLAKAIDAKVTQLLEASLSPEEREKRDAAIKRAEASAKAFDY